MGPSAPDLTSLRSKMYLHLPPFPFPPPPLYFHITPPPPPPNTGSLTFTGICTHSCFNHHNFFFPLALGGVHDCELTDDYCKRYFVVGLLLREVRTTMCFFWALSSRQSLIFPSKMVEQVNVKCDRPAIGINLSGNPALGTHVVPALPSLSTTLRECLHSTEIDCFWMPIIYRVMKWIINERQSQLCSKWRKESLKKIWA